MRNGTILFCLGAAIVVVTKFSAFDLWMSDQVYNFGLGSWAIDHSNSVWRPILYEGPKALIIAFGLALLASIIRPALLPKMKISRQEAVFLLLCMATVPAVVSVIRHHSGVSCPRVLQHYGGEIDNHYGHVNASRFFQEARPGGCWPSGHASGGFALLCLAFLGRAMRTRLQFAMFAVGVGGAMGVYQVLRGAHFASHIVITMLIALVLIQAIRLVMPE